MQCKLFTCNSTLEFDWLFFCKTFLELNLTFKFKVSKEGGFSSICNIWTNSSTLSQSKQIDQKDPLQYEPYVKPFNITNHKSYSWSPYCWFHTRICFNMHVIEPWLWYHCWETFSQRKRGGGLPGCNLKLFQITSID